MFWFRFTPKQDKIFVCASGTCSIRRVAGATSGSPAAAASRSADSGSHCSVPYQQLYKNTKSVRASSTPSQPPASALQMDAAVPVWPRSLPSPAPAADCLWYLLFLLAREKMTSNMFWIRMTSYFPQNSVFIYRERSHPKLIQFRFDFYDLYHRRQTSDRRQGEVDCPNCST